MSEEKLPIDKLIKIYIKMRDARKAIEAQSNAIEEQMGVVEAQLLDICKDTNVSSLKTPYGRIVRSIKTFYTTADWPSMHQFIKEHDALDLVERRIHQSNMKTFLEENANLLPLGLNADRKYTVVVYRK